MGSIAYQCIYCRNIRLADRIVMDCPRCGRRVQYESIDQMGYTCNVVDVHRLRTLTSNLATAAGLCAAFCEGFDAGFTSGGEGFNGEYAPRLTAEKFQRMAQETDCGGAYQPSWKPGCGRPVT